ncbi:uncharacterized protein RAG0_00077 [Rhynchosporium agropyri]|uniref:Uncharacterized protein n=1 Tax=Rhynchosporium agropyri TaxID=914238 RepID=A0A1E1JRE6_9HELO|nr:uncharacterized protein RAG0_00077 [Rhynchosporium agropyri]
MRPEAFDSITNEERVCQLCKLREQEKALRKEHEELSMKAHEAYKKHVEASRFLCEHDGLKTAIASTLSAGIGVDDMSLWYTADMERAKKGAELRVMEKKITKLREEMQQHFWDSV